MYKIKIKKKSLILCAFYDKISLWIEILKLCIVCDKMIFIFIKIYEIQNFRLCWFNGKSCSKSFNIFSIFKMKKVNSLVKISFSTVTEINAHCMIIS